MEIEINDISNNKTSTVIDSPPVIDTSDLDLDYLRQGYDNRCKW